MAKTATEDKPDVIDSFDRRKYILAIMLSVVEPDTLIHSRSRKTHLLDNRLDDQISRILFEERENDLVNDSFTFDSNYRYRPHCVEVKEYLSVFFLYGVSIGLENWGCDFDYKITSKTRKIAEKAKEHFSDEEIRFLQELGKQIKTY